MILCIPPRSNGSNAPNETRPRQLCCGFALDLAGAAKNGDLTQCIFANALQFFGLATHWSLRRQDSSQAETKTWLAMVTNQTVLEKLDY
jgi:hypothetical protein